jgi:hypothetical protein
MKTRVIQDEPEEGQPADLEPPLSEQPGRPPHPRDPPEPDQAAGTTG